MDQETAFRILNKRKLVSDNKEVKKPLTVTVKVNSSVDYTTDKSPDQIGIVSLALMTDYHMDKAVKLIKELEFQEALNCQCSKSIFKGEFFPKKGTYVDAVLDYVEIEKGGKTEMALMVVGIQPPIQTETTSAGKRLKMMMSGSVVDKQEELFISRTSKSSKTPL